MRRPCDNCPWRVDAPRGYWDPEHFREIWRNCQDDGLHRMLCHKSRNKIQLAPGSTDSAVDATKPILLCQGWLRVMGRDSIGVRIAIMRGLVTDEEIEDTDGPELFDSFSAMLKANGIDPPERNRFR